jgi:predicted transcriptional regulator
MRVGENPHKVRNIVAGRRRSAARRAEARLTWFASRTRASSCRILTCRGRYNRDFRMRVGENPHKVRNIVAAQLPAFRSLYGGLIT